MGSQYVLIQIKKISQMKIDLRSDTFTHPTAQMLEAMMKAKVGDDVFSEDPTVNELEDKTARLFGMESGLFCPSGTMTNQIAINVHTEPGQEVICHPYAHIYNYEGGGLAFNSGVQVRTTGDDKGQMDPEKIQDLIHTGPDLHGAPTGLISLENTSNKGGGTTLPMADIMAIKEIANRNHLPTHLDGARIFNALVETGDTSLEMGKQFDSLSVCLSKGLGAPVGSVLIGSSEFIEKARRIRKRFGGAMRQSGYLAAAGIYALDHHVERLAEDHKKAKEIASILKDCSFVESLVPVETNIVIFSLIKEISQSYFIKNLEREDIYAISMGPNKMRFVTHLDYTDEHHDRLTYQLNKLNQHF